MSHSDSIEIVNSNIIGEEFAVMLSSVRNSIEFGCSLVGSAQEALRDYGYCDWTEDHDKLVTAIYNREVAENG